MKTKDPFGFGSLSRAMEGLLRSRAAKTRTKAVAAPERNPDHFNPTWSSLAPRRPVIRD